MGFTNLAVGRQACSEVIDSKSQLNSNDKIIANCLLNTANKDIAYRASKEQRKDITKKDVDRWAMQLAPILNGRGRWKYIEYQTIESELCTSVLRESVKQGFLVISTHDGFLVEEANLSKLKEIVHLSFREATSSSLIPLYTVE